MKYKYQVGDLLTTGSFLYLIEGIRYHRYYVRDTERDHQFWWDVKHADNDKHLKKVN